MTGLRARVRGALSWRGRVGRLRFLLGVLGTFALSAPANVLGTTHEPALTAIAFLLLAIVAWLLVVLPVRRMRDLGVPARRFVPAYVVGLLLSHALDEQNHIPHHALLQGFQALVVLVLALWPGRRPHEPSAPPRVVANDR